MVSAEDDRLPKTNSKGREGQRGSLEPMGPGEAAHTPESVRVTGLPRDAGKPCTHRKVTSHRSDLPACPRCSPQAVANGWQNLSTPEPPNWPVNQESVSYITSESSGSLSLIFRNTLADGGDLKRHASAK